MRSRVLLVTFLAACTQQAPAAVAKDTTPRLVVLLVIDQWPTWSFLDREPLLHKGIGRLLHEGTVFPRARYPYASTYTAPGHAALSTGAPPSVTGVINNEWYDRDEGKPVESIADSGYLMLAVGGWRGELVDPSRPRISGWRLRVDGIGDVLKAATRGKARAVGVSLKNRAAIFATGRHADLAIWYDDGQRAFTTSSWYARELPGWLERIAHDQPIGPRLADDWVPLDAALLARAAHVPDDAPGEARNTTFGATFPHRALALSNPAESIKQAPLGDTVVVEAALAAVDGEELGKHDAPDYLAVSFSVHDYIGHEYGQESWEELDDLLRLDASIGALLDGLEARLGAGRVAVVLTSDHGAPRMPDAHPGTVRVDVANVARAAEAAMRPIVGPGSILDYDRDPTLYVTRRVRLLPPEVRERALDAAVAAIQKVPGIGYAARTDLVGPADGTCAGRPEAEAALCLAIDRERSGEIFFGPGPGSLILDREGDAISHGSANDDDRLVPVILWGPGVPAGRHETVVSTLQVAPTLARFLAIPPPPGAHEPPLP